MKKDLIRIITLCLLSVLFLCAFGKATELVNEAKIIDLSKAIETPLPGGNSMTDLPDEGSDEEGGSENSVPADRTIRIVIEGESISYDGKVLGARDNFGSMLTSDSRNGAEFILVDNFADSNVYKNALRALEKLRRENGLRFSESEE